MVFSKKIKRAVFLLFICLTGMSSGQVRLPKLISDGMVLQRDSDVNIWGRANPNEKISINFLGLTHNTISDSNGDWKIELSGLSAGGPYTMTITAANSIEINDIMIGDVWVCSGQSNMELPMKRVSWNYPGEIENSENRNIRQFIVPDRYNFTGPQNDLTGGNWKSASPENTPDFSAAAYFFARKLYEKYKVPIGLINSALGGSPVESWISPEALKKFPNYYSEARIFKDSTLIGKIEDADKARSDAWYSMLTETDEGYKDPQRKWSDFSLDVSGWDEMEIPGYWAGTKLGPVNGSVWFRKQVDIPGSLAGKSAKLVLGRIVDGDSAFVNGKFVGTVSYQYPPRRYQIPEGLLKAGENIVAVKVISNIGNGGFVPEKQYAIVFKDSVVDLKGKWKFHLGAEMPPLESQTFIRWKPVGLYNAMIAPLLNFRIKGVIWYQGESNAEKPGEYFSLFSTMINDWRNKWNEGNFPFLFVQLPNFMEAKKEPSESNWALMREAQLQTLSLPNTAMAVTIDIGEWNDIHPLDKKDVGERLSLAAEKIAYGEKDIVYSGPVYKSFVKKGNKIILSFSNTGSGLSVRGNGELRGFAIASSDRKFVWANAKIENDKIVVWNDDIKDPSAVRYAWADNPVNANLCNKEGLPASPFRTDSFNCSTELLK